MTEQELRALVREAIARHAGTAPGVTDLTRGAGVNASFRLHVSHSTFPVGGGSDGDGACIIEPAVTCNHCGFCKSLGH